MNDEAVQAFRRHLAQASYHYADDHGSEWGAAGAEVAAAARIAMREGWTEEQVKEAYGDEPFLVAHREVMARIAWAKKAGERA